MSVLLDRRASSAVISGPAAIERLLAEHESGHFDHSFRLWALLVLEWWHREWIDR